MNASCQCGQVAFKTPLPAPLALYICHCTECQHQSGSAFGSSAIFPRFPLSPATQQQLSCYTRGTDTGNTLDCYFCKNCGSRVMHVDRAASTVRVKAGCLQGLDWKGAVHIWTKRAVVPIPEGVVAWEAGPDDVGEQNGEKGVGAAVQDE